MWAPLHQQGRRAKCPKLHIGLAKPQGAGGRGDELRRSGSPHRQTKDGGYVSYGGRAQALT